MSFPTSRVSGKWPKTVPKLTDEQIRIGDDWMHYWHKYNSDRGKYMGMIQYGHTYVAQRKGPAEGWTLEIGAGLGDQLVFEKDSLNPRYIAMEYRLNMAQSIRKRFPQITCCLGDCQGYLPLKVKSMDRIVAIHVLEHLPNLPACVKAIRQVLKDSGRLLAIIPCEGGMVYGVGRHMTSRPVFEKRYRVPYTWFIRSEHVNTAWEILEELDPHFEIVDSSYFPFRVPLIHFNAAIALTLAPRT